MEEESRAFIGVNRFRFSLVSRVSARTGWAGDKVSFRSSDFRSTRHRLAPETGHDFSPYQRPTSHRQGRFGATFRSDFRRIAAAQLNHLKKYFVTGSGFSGT